MSWILLHIAILCSLALGDQTKFSLAGPDIGVGSPFEDFHNGLMKQDLYPYHPDSEYRRSKTKEYIGTNGNDRNSQKEAETEPTSVKPDQTRQESLRGRFDFSFPEIFIIATIAIFFSLIIMILCLGSTNCTQRFLNGRKRLQKAIQYRPTSAKSSVTPTQIEDTSEKEGIEMPGIFKIS